MRADSGAVYASGAAAAEAILRQLGRADVAKALNPLDASDFLVIVDRLSRELQGVTGPAEAKAMKSAIERLDVDWRNLSPAGRSAVVRAAKQALTAVPNRVLPRLDHTFEARANGLMSELRHATVRRFGLHIGTSLSETDERIARFVRESQANFIRDEYGRRQEAFSERARQIVAHGLERGLGSEEIAGELASSLPAEGLRRSRNYWDVVSMAFANRARSCAQVSAFDEAGIERFRFDAILDAVTSRVCRFMHGRVFSVKRAVDRMRQVEKLRDPERIRELQPFVQIGAAPEGHQILFYEQGGRRHAIAQVEASADEDDQAGTFSRAWPSERLEDAGIAMPPLHGRCRSTIVSV